ncbi:hypothetical protein PBY51_024491 [Eleginops maclovinus]|uniref:Uncharacterized protein n=1 Tax=Eleginops maclovinus TaxID=56733 RepID=A0AAN8AP31_ELEMC|nr:hypothetical protein PBY51_024491 [Eleginops maclovinus]
MPPQRAVLHAMLSRQSFLQVSPAEEVWRPAAQTTRGWKPPLTMSQQPARAPSIQRVYSGNPKVGEVTFLTTQLLDKFPRPAGNMR